MWASKQTGMRVGGAVHKLQQRGMAENLNAIKMRITSTANIQKITKSMKMVSAAKLRGDQARLEIGKSFGATFTDVFSAAPGEEDVGLPELKKPLYVALVSDRGLCGGCNSFVAKATKVAIDEDLDAGKDPQVMVLGDKAGSQLARLAPNELIGQVLERSKAPANFAKTLVLADRIISARPDADAFTLVFNKFVSAIRYDTETLTVPNYAALGLEETEHGNLPFPLSLYDFEFEAPEEALRTFTEYALATQLYGCIIDSATSEQSARMQAMDNASKNASEMVEKLTIKYNRARQAKITTELIEIISGAESLKG